MLLGFIAAFRKRLNAFALREKFWMIANDKEIFIAILKRIVSLIVYKMIFFNLRSVDFAKNYKK
tara:strand:- start:439 stop:630 length:192 start_codon:yes stop_codon:yes gene_type:complete